MFSSIKTHKYVCCLMFAMGLGFCMDSNAGRGGVELGNARGTDYNNDVNNCYNNPTAVIIGDPGNVYLDSNNSSNCSTTQQCDAYHNCTTTQNCN